MKPYRILKDFIGSQDGRFSEQFKAGTVADLSEYLAAAIDPSWARPANAPEPPPSERRGKPTK